MNATPTNTGRRKNNNQSIVAPVAAFATENDSGRPCKIPSISPQMQRPGPDVRMVVDEVLRPIMIGMHFIEPCLPTIRRTVPTGQKWAYEIKHDGFRFLAVRQRMQVSIYSRGGYDWSKQLPTIAKVLLALPVRSVAFDGEGVICGPMASPSSIACAPASMKRRSRGFPVRVRPAGARWSRSAQ